MIGGTGLTAAASDVELNPAGTYPVVKDGTLEFDCFTMSMPNVEDLQTNDFTKYMEEKTGITMNFLTGGRDDWSDKLNLMYTLRSLLIPLIPCTAVSLMTTLFNYVAQALRWF